MELAQSAGRPEQGPQAQAGHNDWPVPGTREKAVCPFPPEIAVSTFPPLSLTQFLLSPLLWVATYQGRPPEQWRLMSAAYTSACGRLSPPTPRSEGRSKPGPVPPPSSGLGPPGPHSSERGAQAVWDSLYFSPSWLVYLFNSFIRIEFTSPKIHSFKVCSMVVFVCVQSCATSTIT